VWALLGHFFLREFITVLTLQVLRWVISLDTHTHTTLTEIETLSSLELSIELSPRFIIVAFTFVVVFVGELLTDFFCLCHNSLDLTTLLAGPTAFDSTQTFDATSMLPATIPTTDFSISLCLHQRNQSATDTGLDYIFSNVDEVKTCFGFFVIGSSSELAANIMDEQLVQISSGSKFWNSNWHRFVVTVSASSISFYVDGQLAGEPQSLDLSVNFCANQLLLGGSGNTASNEWLTGDLMEVVLHSTELSSDDVSALGTCVAPSPTNSVSPSPSLSRKVGVRKVANSENPLSLFQQLQQLFAFSLCVFFLLLCASFPCLLLCASCQIIAVQRLPLGFPLEWSVARHFCSLRFDSSVVAISDPRFLLPVCWRRPHQLELCDRMNIVWLAVWSSPGFKRIYWYFLSDFSHFRMPECFRFFPMHFFCFCFSSSSGLIVW
jgi:hypothetical protein